MEAEPLENVLNSFALKTIRFISLQERQTDRQTKRDRQTETDRETDRVLCHVNQVLSSWPCLFVPMHIFNCHHTMQITGIKTHRRNKSR